MQLKQTSYSVVGMNKDLSKSLFSDKNAFDCYNIRFSSINDNNELMLISPEKGNVSIPIKDNKGIFGTQIGEAIVNDKIIIFATGLNNGVKTDKIYRLIYDKTTESFDLVSLFLGDLNFSESSRIQTQVYIENENSEKVYWIDGINPPRYINILKDPETANYNSNSFDYSMPLDLKENITVEKLYYGGSFKSGVIQYAFTYFNKSGSESSIFHMTPIQYISLQDRAGKPDELISNSFKIKISNRQTDYDYIRVYSIYRTSLNADYETRKISDIENPIIINEFNDDSILVWDDGTHGEIVTDTKVLFAGSDYIIPKAIGAKDSTLFFGNIKNPLNTVSDDLKSLILSACEFTWGVSTKEIENKSNGNPYYTYKPFVLPAEDGTVIRNWKKGQPYRLGVQLQDKLGKWSDAIWVGDKTNTKRYKTSPSEDLSKINVEYYYGSLNIDKSIVSDIKAAGYKAIRPVCVEPQYQDRTVICQGIVTNTIGTYKDRESQATIQSRKYAYPDYFTRVDSPKHFNFVRYSCNDALLPLDNQPSYNLSVVATSDKTINFSDTIYSPPNLPASLSQYPAGSTYWLDGDAYFYDCNFANMWTMIDVDKSTIESASKISLYGISRVTSNNTSKIIDGPTINDNGTPSDLGSAPYILDRFKTINYSASVKFLYTPFLSNIGSSKIEPYLYPGEFSYFDMVKMPTWSPEKYNSDGPFNDVNWGDNEGNVKYGDLTRFETSNFIYFGFNESLIDDEDYTLEINKPYVIYDNESAVVRLNQDDSSTGIGMYSGEVNKLYAAGASIVDQPRVTVTGTDVCLGTVYVANGTNAVIGTNTRFLEQYNIGSEIGFSTGSSIWYTVTSILDNTHLTIDSNVPSQIGPGSINRQRNYVSPPITTIEFVRTTMDGASSIKYKTGNHISFSIKKSLSSDSTTLPRITNYSFNSPAHTISSCGKPKYKLNQSGLQYTDLIDHKSMFNWALTFDSYKLDEFVVDNITEEYLNNYVLIFDLEKEVLEENRYGGTSDYAIQNNRWIPCGKKVYIEDDTDIILKYTEGDTYIQRYDFVKTYPSSTTQIVTCSEIVSYLLESYVNLDGRSDYNRYSTNSALYTPSNYGIYNSVYTQKDNVFNYRILDKDIFNSDEFKSTICWTNPKLGSELNDPWTTVSLTNSINIDGSYGGVNSIKVFKNELYSFQDKAIARILFNEKSMANASDGSSIQIANSYTTPDYRYVTNTNGAQLDCSVLNTKAGIVFFDYLDKTFNRVASESVTNLSTQKGMSGWMRKNSDIDDPFYISYDKIFGDIFLNNTKHSLCFNDQFDMFTSFYEHQNVKSMLNSSYGFISFFDNRIYNNYKNDNYNTFYDNPESYSYIEYLSNPDPLFDKVYNTVDMRCNIHPTSMKVYNDYQKWEGNLSTKDRTIAHKFNVYRAIIGRDNLQPLKRNRIRSTYSFIGLKFENIGSSNFGLQNVSVNFTL